MYVCMYVYMYECMSVAYGGCSNLYVYMYVGVYVCVCVCVCMIMYA